jgi:cytochrome c oxidase cbb3-type subunit 1
MNAAVLSLVFFTFVAGVAGLLVLLWSITSNRIDWTRNGARVIFDPGEEGQVEEPAAASARDTRVLGVKAGGASTARRSAEDVAARRAGDVSSRAPVLAFLWSAVAWLVIGSALGLTTSLKMTFPDWLNEWATLTFGRVRPMHLNTVIYGWASMAAIAVSLWLMPRLTRRPLLGGRVAVWGVWVWNLGMLLGVGALAAGWTEGVEWLEYPWSIDILFVLGGAMAGVPLILTLIRRRVTSIYVSAWYIGAAFVWFPILFFVANLPWLHFGVEHATVNWWFAHNVLGLWVTPLGLAMAYYFIPKVLGRPVFSYGLSLIGFWSLALFYSQVGLHHLIGGPVPTWLITIAIAHSLMMFVPVVATAVNHHVTMVGRFSTLRYSPTLRFVVLGAMMYTLTSLEGSIGALRSVNRITHFTHFTVAHAHFGLYGFVSFVLFGAIYFLLPRLVEREWPYPSLIRAHFWLALAGIAVYVLALSAGGILQGLAMLDEARPFIDSVTVTIPYLHARTVGGSLMTLAHLVFAGHFVMMATGRGPVRHAQPWARERELAPEVVS